MKSELSCLLDDELEYERQQTLLATLRNDPELRATWCEYHLIGDALRRTPQLDVDLTARVMSGLQREPAILAPQARTSAERAGRLGQGAMRYAAALAGVGVVGWLALSTPQSQTQTMAQNASPRIVRAVAATAVPAELPHATVAMAAGNASRMQGYLVAHQAYSPGNRFDGGAGYVRTVAATR